jgi:hypothetical protein
MEGRGRAEHESVIEGSRDSNVEAGAVQVCVFCITISVRCNNLVAVIDLDYRLHFLGLKIPYGGSPIYTALTPRFAQIGNCKSKSEGD